MPQVQYRAGRETSACLQVALQPPVSRSFAQPAAPGGAIISTVMGGYSRSSRPVSWRNTSFRLGRLSVTFSTRTGRARSSLRQSEGSR